MTIEIVYSGCTEKNVDVGVYQRVKELVNQKNLMKEKGTDDIRKVFICREVNEGDFVMWFIFQEITGNEIVTGVFSDTEALEDMVLIQHPSYGPLDGSSLYEPGFLKAKSGKIIFNKEELAKGSFISVGKFLTAYRGTN